MSTFNGLGRALRWLRDRQGKRQYHVADAAGITKAMLSAYETGKQKPSLDTLEKILEALGCDLNDLHNSLQIVNERPEAIRKPGDQRAGAWDPYRRDRLHDGSGEEAAVLNIYRVLGISKPLSPDEEQAFGEMLQGFHRLLRYLHATVSQAVTERDGESEEPA